ncbi:DUF2470 domain-containing protein [Granulosicoccus sp. 3-233]|uniref:DUF2470 domain-containing protein n=1 Tax=Granulosicoccus sp. 3-233 TaxID=3417969 RepID=UPI003D328741
MNTRDELDPEFVRSVVSHMNKDHADSCLFMVKAFSDQTSAQRAKLTNLDRNSLYFSVENPATDDAREPSAPVDVRIDFSTPLRNELQIRGALISMASHARQILSAELRKKD